MSEKYRIVAAPDWTAIQTRPNKYGFANNVATINDDDPDARELWHDANRGARLTWRRLADEKPEDGQECLVWAYAVVMVGRWNRLSLDFTVYGCGQLSATHWMPLPAPPEGEGR